MWYVFNVFEVGEDIVFDFVGYDDFDYFIGDNFLFKFVMNGKVGNFKYFGIVRWYWMGLNFLVLIEEIVSIVYYEFFMMLVDVVVGWYKFGYFVLGDFGYFFGLL